MLTDLLTDLLDHITFSYELQCYTQTLWKARHSQEGYSLQEGLHELIITQLLSYALATS